MDAAMRRSETPLRLQPAHARPRTRGSWLDDRARSRATSLAVLVAALYACEGCAGDRAAFFHGADRSIVWPAAPETPRVAYLGEFAGAIRGRGEGSLASAWNELVFGPSPASKLVTPHAVSISANGDRVAIADPNASCVHVVDLTTRNYLRVGGDASAGSRLRCPVGVAWAGDELFAIDSELRAVIRILFTGDPRVARSSPHVQTSLLGQNSLRRPAGIAYHPGVDGLYVADSLTHQIVVLDRSGTMVRSFGARGAGDGQLNFPSQIACAPDGTLVVADSLNFRIQRFSPSGQFLGAFGRKGDAAGDFSLPKGVAVDADGTIWVVDAQFENVQAFDAKGRLLLAFGGEGHGPGEFWLPAGLAIDSRRRMWVADSYNRRVQGFQLLP